MLFESYRRMRTDLTTRLEQETSKQLNNTRMERASGSVEAAKEMPLGNSYVARWKERGDGGLGDGVTEAGDGAEGGCLEKSVGSVGVCGEGCSIWHTGHAECTLHRGCGAGGDTSVRGGQEVRAGGHTEGDEGGNLREVSSRGGTGAGKRRKDGVFVAFSVARGRGTEEGKVCCELTQAENALAAGESKDGDGEGICGGAGAKGYGGVVGCEEWVQDLLPTPRRAGLISILLQRGVLPVYCVAVWVGEVGVVV